MRAPARDARARDASRDAHEMCSRDDAVGDGRCADAARHRIGHALVACRAGGIRREVRLDGLPRLDRVTVRAWVRLRLRLRVRLRVRVEVRTGVRVRVGGPPTPSSCPSAWVSLARPRSPRTSRGHPACCPPGGIMGGWGGVGGPCTGGGHARVAGVYMRAYRRQHKGQVLLLRVARAEHHAVRSDAR
eukprot:scaffold98117_cov59-Phaeocystis_antarctica.AAC.3